LRIRMARARKIADNLSGLLRELSFALPVTRHDSAVPLQVASGSGAVSAAGVAASRATGGALPRSGGTIGFQHRRVTSTLQAHRGRADRGQQFLVPRPGE